jgi:hypothetical protein
MKLDLNASCVQNGPTLSSELTLYFLLPIMIKGGKSKTMQTQALLNSKAFACFIDKGLVRQHNLVLVEKPTPRAVKVINGQNLFAGLVMHKTKALTIIIRSHRSKIVFNVISSPTNLIIVGLSWLILHNPQGDYKMKSFHFES